MDPERGADPEAEQAAAQVKRRTRAGILWSAGGSVATRLLGLLTSLLLTKFISPAESGAVNVATTLMATVSILSTIGFGQYVATQRRPAPEVAWNATLAHGGLGLVSVALALCFRQRLAALFGSHGAAQFIPLLALALLLDRLGYVPERVMVAHMEFRRLSIMRGAGELFYCGAVVPAAFLGQGPWCIVWGNLARSGVRLLLTLRYVPLRQWYARGGASLATMRHLLGFGLPVMVAGVASFATRRWDNLLVGRYYGEYVLGLYGLAYNLAEVPATHIVEMIVDVLAPSFARLEGAPRRQVAVDTVALLAIVVFPMAVGLGLVAPALGRLMPRSWAGLAPYLMGLAILSVTRPVGMVLAVYMQALRRPGAWATVQIVQIVVLLGSLVLIGHLLPDAPLLVCVAVGATFTLGSALAIALLWVIDQVPPWQLIRVQLLPVPALGLMALSVKGLGLGLGSGWQAAHPAGTLGLLVVTGGLAYCGGMLLFFPRRAEEVLRYARGLVTRA